MTLIATVSVVLALLLISEAWWRIRKPHGELSRKFIHITVGTFVAFWPYFLTWNQIILLSIAFIGSVLVSRYFGIFTAIHSVERPTWGEVCFALAVGILALVTREPAIYTAAVLHMGIADGLAAIAGKKWGAHNSYVILGHTKSIAGSLTFLVVSLWILIGYNNGAAVLLQPLQLLGIAAVAMVLENISLRGLDNLSVPLFVAAALTILG